ncbi:MAG: tetratricopeptide repeat protein [Methyloligella sp. ZOD6]
MFRDVRSLTTKKINELDRSSIVQELGRILEAPEFHNSEVLRNFLTFVVEEAIEGRADGLKSSVIAQEVFKHRVQNERTDNAVRTAAVRLRTALAAYRSRQPEPRPVVISIPKGGYAPKFEYPGWAGTGNAAPKRKLPKSWLPKLLAACLSIMVLSGIVVAFITTQRSVRMDWDGREPAVFVYPAETGEADAHAIDLARRIDYRLASQLAAIGLGRVISANQQAEQRESGSTDIWPFHLFSRVESIDSEISLHLMLMDDQGIVRWSRDEVLTSDDISSLKRTISFISFELLGENGTVPLLLERRYGQSYRGASCVTRAILLLRIQDVSEFNQITSCLEEHLEANPYDGAAWAVLGATQVIRARYHTATAFDGYDMLLDRARYAIGRAIELAPGAYLTRVASMHLALSEGDVDLFLRRQQLLRAEYPGDIFQHLRIASRLTRLERADQALEIFHKAMALGVNVAWQEPAFAYYVQGDYAKALEFIERTDSTQEYVLLIKAAIFGQLGMEQRAARTIETLVTQYPRIAAEYYPWHLSLGWSEHVLDLVAQGLAAAGLEVDLPPS